MYTTGTICCFGSWSIPKKLVGVQLEAMKSRDAALRVQNR